MSIFKYILYLFKEQKTTVSNYLYITKEKNIVNIFFIYFKVWRFMKTTDVGKQ